MDNVLIIAPHIDDEVLGVGGSISKHIAAGDKVTVVAVTDRLEFKDKQREEAIQVSKYFDLEDYFFLGLKDMYLDVCMKDIIDPLENIYKHVAPSIVYGPYSGDINIDHQSVHRATTVVCRTHQEHGLDKFLLYEIPSSTEQGVVDNFKPNYFNVLRKILRINWRHLNTMKMSIDLFQILGMLMVYPYTHNLEVCSAPQSMQKHS